MTCSYSMGVLVPDLCKGHYIVCCPDKLHEPQRRCRCLTKLITLEIRFWPSSSLAILVQDMVVMGKVYPKMCTYIYIHIPYNTSFYHISFVRPFIIFKETPTSSVLPFRFSILGVNPPRPLRVPLRGSSHLPDDCHLPWRQPDVLH